MKNVLLASLGGMLWATSLLSISGAIEGEQENPPTKDAAVLGAAAYEEREQAGKSLWAQGEESRNLLTALSLANDPEEAWRARRLLRWVDLEMTPETPAEIVDLVENYLAANSAKEREVIYEQLLAKEAYVQLFRLPNHVGDKVVAQNLADRVAELAGRVALEKILAGEDLEALAILEDSKSSRAGQLRWVALASALGMREELWGDLSSADQMRFARWEGDLELIESLASPDHEVQLTLQLLAGDPIPFLTKQAARNDQTGFRTRIAKAFWEGKEEEQEVVNLVDTLTRTLEENGLEESEDILVLLTQLGYADRVLPYFEEKYPTDMFEYYHGAERLQEAFQCLGLQVGEPVPQAWIEAAIAQVEDEFDLANEGCRRLLVLSQFYVERGEFEEANKLVEALYIKMEELGLSDLNAYLSSLAGRRTNEGMPGYPEFALRKAQTRKEEDFQADSFLSEAFFAEESVFLLQRFLSNREAEMADWDKVRAIFAIFGRKVDFPPAEVEKILKELEESARENASEGEWRVLMETGLIRGDLALVERALRHTRDILADDEFMSRNLAALLFADGRFEESAEIMGALLAEDSSRFDLMEYLTVALEMSGKKTKAREWENRIEKLALGDGRWLVTMGEIWGEVGNWERQRQYYQRALLLFPSESRAWIQQLYRVAEGARSAKKWQQAAACREAFNTFRLFDLVGSPRYYFLYRGQLDVTRAMAAFEEGDLARGDEILDRLSDYCGHDPFFADDVFPVLRAAGLHEQAERIWARVEPSYRHSLSTFPDGHNAHNTAAWVAARAACDLDEAMEWVDRALEGKPDSSAYLDTKAEVFFAQGKREEALKWSQKACEHSDGTGFMRAVQTLGMLRNQHRHFRDDPFPLEGLD